MDASKRGRKRGHSTSTCPDRERKAPSDGAAGDDGRPAEDVKKQRARGGGGGAGRSDAGASSGLCGAAGGRFLGLLSVLL